MSDEKLNEAKEFIKKAENKFGQFQDIIADLNKEELNWLMIYMYKLLVKYKGEK